MEEVKNEEYKGSALQVIPEDKTQKLKLGPPFKGMVRNDEYKLPEKRTYQKTIINTGRYFLYKLLQDDWKEFLEEAKKKVLDFDNTSLADLKLVLSPNLSAPPVYED
jgi:hypothetical protein